MAMRLFWAAALCICGVSAGLLPASTQVFIPAASPTPFIYLDQPQQHETLTAHQPLTYQLSLAYPGAPTASAPIATPATLTGISGANVVTESVSSRAGDRISPSGLERTSGIDRQRERQQQQQIQQRQQQLREQQQIQQQQIQQQQIQQQQIQQQQIQEQQQRQQQQQQQTQQRHRFEYSVNEFGRREGVDALRQAQNQQQQIAQQQQFQQQQQQQFAQQQLQDQQRYDYNVNEASFGGISREGRPETADVNLDASRHAEPIQSRNRASFLAEQHGVPQTQAVEGNVHRRPDISSLTLSLQRQGHGSFSTGSTRSQLPGSLSIQRQQSQTEQRIAFQGLGVDAETARFQQRQREQQAAAAAARVSGPASASFEEATVRAYPTVLPTLAPTVAAVSAHGLPQPHPTDSGFSSYSVRFVSPQFGYGYYGDQHSLQQQSSILVRSSLEGAGLASNAVGATGDIVGNH